MLPPSCNSGNCEIGDLVKPHQIRAVEAGPSPQVCAASVQSTLQARKHNHFLYSTAHTCRFTSSASHTAPLWRHRRSWKDRCFYWLLHGRKGSSHKPLGCIGPQKASKKAGTACAFGSLEETPMNGLKKGLQREAGMRKRGRTICMRDHHSEIQEDR